MSEEDFLARWSRRKRAVAEAEQVAPQPAADGVRPSAAEQEAQVAQPAPNDGTASEETDLSILPPLESIAANTDVTAFLRRGVPEELTRAALRKAWTSDPAIRDFVGLAENAWDFNDPTAMHGFGPLDFTPEQVREMAAKLVGDVQEASEQIERALEPTAAQHEPAPERAAAESKSDHGETAAPIISQNENAAPQHGEENSPVQPSKARRHGGALPG